MTTIRMLMKTILILDDNLDHNDYYFDHPHYPPDQADNPSDDHPDPLYKDIILMSIITIVLTTQKTILAILVSILPTWI